MICRMVTVLHSNFFLSNSSICYFFSVPAATTLLGFSVSLFLLLFYIHICVTSCSICLSPPVLFHLA